MPEYAPRPNDAAGSESFPPTSEDTSPNPQPPQAAALTALALQSRSPQPASRPLDRWPGVAGGEIRGLAALLEALEGENAKLLAEQMLDGTPSEVACEVAAM